MRGRRRPDTPIGDLPDDLQPGDLWKVLTGDGSRPVKVAEPSNLTGCMWQFVGPHGGVGTLTLHTVREHDDGTVSIRPNDGSSNSILFRQGDGGREWHGYVEHCVWESV